MASLRRLAYDLVLVLGPFLLSAAQAALAACGRLVLRLLALTDRSRLIEQLACCVSGSDERLDQLLVRTIADLSDDGIAPEELLAILLDGCSWRR